MKYSSLPISNYVVVHIGAKQVVEQTSPFITQAVSHLIEATGLRKFLLLHPTKNGQFHESSHTIKMDFLEVLFSLKAKDPSIQITAASFRPLDWIPNSSLAPIIDEYYEIEVGKSDLLPRFRKKVIDSAGALICSETTKSFYHCALVKAAQEKAIPIVNMRNGAFIKHS